MATDDALIAHLNGETGQIGWEELQRHFARGVVVRVAPGLDLVAVAATLVRDDKAAVSAWLETGQVARAESADAKRWHKQQSRFWAVVAAPWVLVQEIE